MIPTILTSLLVAAALMSAVPTPAPSEATVNLKDAGIISSNNSKDWETTPFDADSGKTVVQPDEVLLYGNGRVQIVKQAVYEAMLKEDALFNVHTPTPDKLAVNETVIIDDGKQTSSINARCTWYKALQIQQTQNFVDWDVPMSSVIKGDATGRTLVSVSAGHFISNAVTVTAGAKYAIIKDYLEASLEISYTRTWQSSYAAAYTFGVTANRYSVVISQPRTTRRIGRLLEGCVGSMKQTSTFTADQRYQGSFDGLNWVQGAITTCECWEYPIARCIGGGHIW